MRHDPAHDHELERPHGSVLHKDDHPKPRCIVNHLHVENLLVRVVHAVVEDHVEEDEVPALRVVTSVTTANALAIENEPLASPLKG